MYEVRTKLGEGGRIIIPAAFRHALHLEAGDDIVLHIEDNEIYITTPENALFKLQAKVKNYLDTNNKPISLVDELIAKRRREAQHEY
jgi:AbrB family looped-hinge helix DNA binding protein